MLKVVSVCLTPLLLSGLISSCGKKKSNNQSSSASVQIVGSLALSSSPSLSLANSADSTTALSDLDIYCVTFQVPPKSGISSLDDEGAFSVAIEGAAGESIGCFFLKEDDVVGTMVFKDDSKKSLNGDSSSKDKLAFSGEVGLGAIVLDLETGLAEVEVSQISSGVVDTEVSVKDAFDFTGTYKATSVGLDMPTGYKALCPENQDDCKGPSEGMTFWMQRVAGKDTSGKDAFAASLWASKSYYETCGSKLGFSYADGIKKAGIDFSASGIAEGDYSWATGFVDGWKSNTATAPFAIREEKRIDNLLGYKGTAKTITHYTPNTTGSRQVVEAFHFDAITPETGCKLAGAPYKMQDGDWDLLSNSISCGDNGLCTHTNTGTKDGKKLTCITVGGDFLGNAENPSAATVLAPGTYSFDWDNDMKKLASSGDACKDIASSTEAGKLAQLKCYSSAYWDLEDDNLCLKQIRPNWNAKTATEFMLDNGGPARPNNQFVFELFEYSSSNSGSFRGQDRYYESVDVNGAYIECEVLETFALSLVKDGDAGDIIVDMISDTRNMSSTPACIAEFGEGSVQKSLFKMIKQ